MTTDLAALLAEALIEWSGDENAPLAEHIAARLHAAGVRVDRGNDDLRARLAVFARLMEAEWYNGNMPESTYLRLNADLSGLVAAYIPAAGVRVTGDADRGYPDEDVQEAVYRALLYVEQRKPRPMKPLAVIRALAQDGYRIVRVTGGALREALASAVIEALDVYGTMGNGEGWTLDLDVIGTLWLALTPQEKARTGYNVAEMDARIAGERDRREGRHPSALATEEPR